MRKVRLNSAADGVPGVRIFLDGQNYLCIEVMEQIYHIFTSLRKQISCQQIKRSSSTTDRNLCPEVHPNLHIDFAAGSLVLTHKGPLNHGKMGTDAQVPDISKPVYD